MLAAAARLAADMSAELLVLRFGPRRAAAAILAEARRRRIQHLLLGPTARRLWAKELWESGLADGTLALCWELPSSQTPCAGFTLETRMFERREREGR
ncbi:MAG: hypothetical protein KGL53_03295 [Elusimicrobia bacterium]|nr:hypothetical protein [Elusimicrobiota bacterium]